MSKFLASTFCCAFSSALLIHGWDDRLALLQPAHGEHGVQPIGAEDPHQVVVERELEQRAAGGALAAGAAAQLVVDAPALVALGADDEEPAGIENLLLLTSISALTASMRRSRSGPAGTSASSVATRISRLPPSLMSVRGPPCWWRW